MRRQVLYVAAPLRPTPEELDMAPTHQVERGHGEWELDYNLPVADSTRMAWAIEQNIQRALRWLAWLRKSFPETTFVAPWIASVLAGADDADPAQREAGMLDACAVLERCDGIVLCGGRISSGMRREMEHGLRRGLDDSCEPHIQEFEVYDTTRTLLALPHPEAPAAPRGRTFRVWCDHIVRCIA